MDVQAFAAMEATLGAAAAACDDLTPPVYDRFFARHPEARALFNDSKTRFRLEERTRGRMLNEVIDLLMALAAGETYAQETIDQSAREHASYGAIAPGAYQGLLDALFEVLAELAGPAWTPIAEAAWRRQAERLMSIVRETIGPAAKAGQRDKTDQAAQ